MLSEVPDKAGVAFVIEEAAGADVVHVFGEVDIASAPQLEEMIGRTRPNVRLVVDFTQCRYFDTTALSVLIRARKARANRMRVVCPPGAHARKIFEITNLVTALGVVPTLASALIAR